MGVSIPLPADCEPTALPSELIPLTTCTCIFLVYPCEYRQRVRVVKELVLKANGLCPREFKSRRCRIFSFFFFFLSFFFFLFLVHVGTPVIKWNSRMSEKRRGKSMVVGEFPILKAGSWNGRITGWWLFLLIFIIDVVCLVVGNNRVNGAKFGSGVVDIHLFEKDQQDS